MKAKNAWLTKGEAMELLDVGNGTLCSWTASHPAFRRRRIRTRHEQNGRGRPSPFYSARDIEEVRKYRSRQPEWGLAKDAAAEFVNASVCALKNWAKRGCPHLGGRNLERRIEKRVSSEGRTHKILVYKLNDLQQIRDWKEETSDDFISLDDAESEFGWKKARVWKWTKHCPWLGRKLMSNMVYVKGENLQIRKRRHASRADLRKVHDKLDADSKSDEVWITRDEAADQFGFTISSIYHWGRDECPWLDEKRKIRTKSVRRKRGSKRAGSVWLYRVEDIQKIKNRLGNVSAASC